ncbi:hypothetical protein Bca101_026041 [Brassica carinata]
MVNKALARTGALELNKRERENLLSRVSPNPFRRQTLITITASSSSRWPLEPRLRSPRVSCSGLSAPPQPFTSSSRLSSLSGVCGLLDLLRRIKLKSKASLVSLEHQRDLRYETRQNARRVAAVTASAASSHSSQSPLLCSSKVVVELLLSLSRHPVVKVSPVLSRSSLLPCAPGVFAASHVSLGRLGSKVVPPTLDHSVPGWEPDTSVEAAWSHFGECSTELSFRLFSCFFRIAPVKARSASDRESHTVISCSCHINFKLSLLMEAWT